MAITIKQIAEKTGVSTATVSHALNQTRYVRPELVQRIVETAKEHGYFDKNKRQPSHPPSRTGRLSEIAFVVPDVKSVLYSQLITHITKMVRLKGYILSVFLTEGDAQQEIHIITELMSNRRIAGIILIPVLEQGKIYKKLLKSDIPLVCLEKIPDIKGVTKVTYDERQGAELAVRHLIRNGHEKILMLMEEGSPHMVASRREGYMKACREHGIPCGEKWAVKIPVTEDSSSVIIELIRTYKPTAVFAASDAVTLNCLRALQSMNLEYPRDISVVGFGEGEWNALAKYPITSLQQDTVRMAEEAVTYLFERLNNGRQDTNTVKKIPMRLIVRKSTQLLAKGPNGERVVYPDEILLSKEEEELVRKGNYTVAISLHYTGTEWTRLHEKAIRTTLENLGVRVSVVMDAHFDWKTQNMQLLSLMNQNPDAVIAVPTDEEHTAPVFKKLSKKTKLIFINGLPHGFKEKDYSYWVSVNELENGGNAAKIMGSHFGDKKVKIGMLVHGAPFFATKQRDYFAEELLRRHYPNIQIAAAEKFIKEDNVEKVCIKMLEQHPDIKGLYVTWDRPALKVLEILKAAGRTDIAVVTTDLDYEIASYLSNNEMVIGLSSQRPYEQGTAVAAATARALIEKGAHGCIGVTPYPVLPKNLEKSWNEILKSKLPKF